MYRYSIGYICIEILLNVPINIPLIYFYKYFIDISTDILWKHLYTLHGYTYISMCMKLIHVGVVWI